MPPTFDALRFVSLGSGAAWWAVGIVPAIRTHLALRSERALVATALLVGGWAFLDAVYPEAGVAQSPDVVFLGLQLTLITFATLAILLTTKWIARGPSRYDPLAVLPVIGSLGLIWTELPSRGGNPSWGYELWAFQQVVYLAASSVLLASLYRGRKDPSAAFHWQSAGTGGILVLAVAVSLFANLYETLTSTSGELWASSLAIPAVVVLVTILPLSADGWNEAFRGGSVIQKRVNAIYMFYRTGEPLFALASSRNLPIGAEQLEGLLAVVGNFVETSVPVSRGYAVTAMRYEGLGIVAVRGEFVIVAAVYDGPAYDALRGELTRALKVFEERSWRQLGTWETATSVAEAAADELSNFLEHPERTTPPRLPNVSPAEMKSRKAS